MPPHVIAAARQGPVRSILLDDSACDRRLAARVFDRAGLALDTAREAAEFFRMIAARRYALALVDHRLGAESGLDVLARLAERGPPRMTRVLLTGNEDPRLAERAMALGCTACICKDDLCAATLSRLVPGDALLTQGSGE